METRNAVIIGIAAIAALYLYSQQAAAYAPSGDGGAPPDTGDSGHWWDVFPSLPGGNVDAQGAADGPGASTFGFDLSPPQPLSLNVDSESNPGINFGILSDIGSTMTGWKTGEYPKYASAIRDAESRYGIPSDGLARLLYQESRYRADVIAGYKRSPVGALGIGQFMPGTARDMGLQLVPSTYNGTETQTYDPFASIDAAGRYLKKLHGMFNDWDAALIAYNWGPGNVQKWLRGDKYLSHGLEVSYNPPEESRKYVQQITADVRFA